MAEKSKERKIESDHSFKSKKFFITILIILLTFFIKWYQVIADWPFVATIVIIVVIYFFVQGRIDISKIKEFWNEHFRITMEDNPSPAGKNDPEEVKK